jgi:GNAT superfamily N-acetyltransferase
VRPEDKPLFVEGWSHLSANSVYRRFLQPRTGLSVGELAFFTEIDHVDHEAIGAIDAVGRVGVGVARYVRDPERLHAAEAAVIVVDGWQGRGLGARLLHRLSDRAVENGIKVFTAQLLATNDTILGLLGQLGEITVTRRDGPTIEVDVDFPVVPVVLDQTLREAARGGVRLSGR